MGQQEADAGRPIPEDSSKLEHNRWRRDVVTAVLCLVVLVVIWQVLVRYVPKSAYEHWYVDKGAFATLLQVVPATVVAVFVFAVGAVFVMVQIISPTLGSRAMEDLIVQRRARDCVIAGMALLLACLALTAWARINNNEASESWEAPAASVLAWASLLYVPFSIWCISSVFHGFVSPTAYSRRLGRWRGERKPLTSERAFHELRALRQWLRTACRVGESRDIAFALDGFQELLRRYCTEKRPDKGESHHEGRCDKSPSEYSRTDELVNNEWRFLLDPRGRQGKENFQKGWFGDEFGRALARCAEVGLRSGQLLRRDLDRLLLLLGGATLELAGFERPGKGGTVGSPELRELREDTRFLPDRIAEIGTAPAGLGIRSPRRFPTTLSSSSSAWLLPAPAASSCAT